MGFQIYKSKCELIPAQTFEYLGVGFDTIKFSVRPAYHRIKATIIAPEVVRSGNRFSQRVVSTSGNHGINGASVTHCSSTQVGLWFQEAVCQWRDQVWLGHRYLFGCFPHRFTCIQMLPKWGGERIVISVRLQGYGQQQFNRITSIFYNCWRFSSHSSTFKIVYQQVVYYQFGQHHQLGLYPESRGFALQKTLSSSRGESCLGKLSFHSVEFIPGKLNTVADQLSRSGQILPT